MTINLKRLKAERIASGMTQDEVAHRMGWKTRTPYAKRENGIVSIGADELAKITLIFGLPMEKITIFFEDNVPEKERLLAQKGEPMEEIKIREDKVFLNGQELKTLTGFEIKSTTENGYAEVKLTLLAKLT